MFIKITIFYKLFVPEIFKLLCRCRATLSTSRTSSNFYKSSNVRRSSRTSSFDKNSRHFSFRLRFQSPAFNWARHIYIFQGLEPWWLRDTEHRRQQRRIPRWRRYAESRRRARGSIAAVCRQQRKKCGGRRPRSKPSFLFYYYRLLPTTRREDQKERRTVSIQKQIAKIKTQGGKKRKKERAQSPEALRLPTNEFRQRRQIKKIKEIIRKCLRKASIRERRKMTENKTKQQVTTEQKKRKIKNTSGKCVVVNIPSRPMKMEVLVEDWRRTIIYNNIFDADRNSGI